MRILIAEDDFTSRTILQGILSTWGYEVVATADGNKALAAMQAVDAPQLAVLDWMMPGLDGPALCRELRKLERRDPLYLILLTCKGESSDIVQGLEAGADDYIAKPYDNEELRARVNVGRRVIEMHGKLVEAWRKIDETLKDAGRIQEELRQSEARFREMAELLPQAIYEVNAQGILTYANSHAFDLTGYSTEDLQKGLNMLRMLIPEDRDRAASGLRRALTGKPLDTDREYRAVRKDGGTFPVAIYSSPIVRNGSPVGLRGVVVDMTEHEKVVEEKERLQALFNQAQKMESIERLAGGLAHDFNNMLGIVIGNAELAVKQIDHNEPLYQCLQEMLKAANRTADFVNQLLAFARKQTIRPKVLDLNDTIPGILKMLRRLIGEDIKLHWFPGKGVGMVKMDPSQIDQLLANLVVNSRDAISGVGKITIKTANTVFDESHCREHAECVPGEYVLLTVTDTGDGMTPEVMGHLFDPFFTTKDVGRGTGLGLATVYGIVKQNNGFIHVHSEPGQGATFKIYLPKLEGAPVMAPKRAVEKKLPEGTETVLVAEDERPLLKIIGDILEMQGYAVLTARIPTEALLLAEKHQGEIHLLITDVVMPEMNGGKLIEKLRAVRPAMKGLFMSGYTADVVTHHGVVDEGVNFIEKPFSPRNLAEKVREVLDKG